jgi:hypothetical protein
MNRATVTSLSALAALLCGATPPAAPPPNGGTIAIEPRTANGEYDRSMPSFVGAAEAALTARGFTILDDPAHAASVAVLTLARVDVGTGLGKDPHSGPHVLVGPGVIVPLSTGDSHIAALTRTSLELQISDRARSVVWDGTAVTVRQADTRTGTNGAVASDLSQALFHAYPAIPRSVIGVP